MLFLWDFRYFQQSDRSVEESCASTFSSIRIFDMSIQMYLLLVVFLILKQIIKQIINLRIS